MGANLIPFFVVIALAGAFLIALLGRKSRWLPDLIGNGSFFNQLYGEIYC